MLLSRRARIVLGGSLAFAVVAGTLITLASGKPQVALHAAFWMTLPVALLIESRTWD